MAVLRLIATASVAVTGGCAYEAPVDPDADPLLNAILGTVVFAGEGEVAPTYVTVFDAANPPPPTGTGAPVTFAAVPPAAFSDDDAGLRAADYAITRLPDGEWLISALLDADGDFNPLTSALAGATCGDWGGAHLADLAGTPAPVPVAGGRAYRDVTVLIGQQFPLERPVFELVTPAAPMADTLLRIRSSAVSTAFADDLPLELGPSCAAVPDPPCGPPAPFCACDPATIVPCGTALWVEIRDADGDGVADPYPSEPQATLGLLDVWPRVYLEYVGDGLREFEYEGRLVPERWVGQAHPLAGEILAVAAANPIPPAQAAAALAPIGTPFPVAELSLTFSPQFRHYHPGGVMGEDANGPYDLVDASRAEVPTGTYAVTVVSFTGQTWTLPNDIGLLGLPSFDEGLDPALQAQPLILGD